jgi:hypothetical protein
MDQIKQKTLELVERDATERSLAWTVQIKDRTMKSVVNQNRTQRSKQFIKSKIYECQECGD